MSASASPLPLPLTPKGARTRRRILDTAERLFAEKGFNGTTLRDVAGAAGLRIPSLYNHFPSKESLYAAVLDQGISPLLEVLSDLTAGESPPDRREFTRRIFELLARRPQLPRLVQHEVLDGGARLSPILSEWFKPTLAKAEEAIRAMPGARRWEPDQIPLLVLALYHMTVGAFTVGPLYEALNRDDGQEDDALERQARFFADVVMTLLPDPPDDA